MECGQANLWYEIWGAPAPRRSFRIAGSVRGRSRCGSEFVEVRGIDEPSDAIFESTRASVDVAEDMNLWFLCLNGFEQFHTSEMFSARLE